MTQNKKSQKQLQIAEQIKRVLANIFSQDENLQIPQTHITILEVDISPDIKNSNIYINIFGDIDKEKLTKELNKNSHYIRKQLSKKLDIRHTPQLNIILDQSGEKADKIFGLVDEESRSLSKIKEFLTDS